MKVRALRQTLQQPQQTKLQTTKHQHTLYCKRDNQSMAWHSINNTSHSFLLLCLKTTTSTSIYVQARCVWRGRQTEARHALQSCGPRGSSHSQPRSEELEKNDNSCISPTLPSPEVYCILYLTDRPTHNNNLLQATPPPTWTHLLLPTQ